MPRGRVGSVLVAVGVVVGVAASLGVLVDFEPARLPPALLNIAAYKLTFLAAGGLIAAGAIVRRRARRRAEVESSALGAAEVRDLAEGQPAIPPGERHRDALRARDPKR
jgi:hypothetical protein